MTTRSTTRSSVTPSLDVGELLDPLHGRATHGLVFDHDTPDRV
jgi:hypothetical protein